MTKKNQPLKFETRALKSTQNIKSEVHAVSPPIYLSSTFERNQRRPISRGVQIQ